MRDKFDKSSIHTDPVRRLLLRAGSALGALSCMKSTAQTIRFEWDRIDPEAAGFARELPEQLDQGVANGSLIGLHAVIIVRRGKLVVERYYNGNDERWGEPLREVKFNADALHDVRSVTKNIVGLLYGIALSECKVPTLDTLLVEAFTDYPELARDEKKRLIKISHVLTMTMGLEWNEDLPYSDPRNNGLAMERSSDRCRYFLTRAVVTNPGEKWQYCSGASEVLGRLIAKGTGTSLLEYARKKLFRPLGIERIEWAKGGHAEVAASWGLRMRALDLARVGELVLQSGKWNGATVVPENWLAESMIPRIDGWPGLRYGYHWHLAQTPSGSPIYAGIGYGGQRLSVYPDHESARVVFMGNYNRDDQVEQLLKVRDIVNAATR
jgi:CubicO group peptidase (beta-lactamase class C family)